jgi:predicted ATPase
MLTQLHINNYKSIIDVTLDISRFNVLIGENCGGKSNLLEAITLIRNSFEIFTARDAKSVTAERLIINELNKDVIWDEMYMMKEIFDWFEWISFDRNGLKIKDRFVNDAFSQRTANDAFMQVLFYSSLMVSDSTPKTISIDNIDTSLNPKLCTKIIKELIRLAKKYDKQVFVTTHNPAILDGIDLGDEEQRLFVVSRNATGLSRFKRIELKDKPKSSTNEELRLSEAFLRGYLGCLPKNF